MGLPDISLRLLQLEDLPLTLSWRNHPQKRIWFNNPNLVTEEQHLHFFNQEKARGGSYIFIIDHAGTAVGQVSVYDIDMTVQTGEIGRLIVAPTQERKGYMIAGCKMLLDFCWRKLQLRDVHLNMLRHNEAAISLYRKLGFIEESATPTSIIFRKMRPQGLGFPHE